MKQIDPDLIKEHRKEEVFELSRRSRTSVVAHFVLFVFVAVVTPMRVDHAALLTVFGVVIFAVSAARMVLAGQVFQRYDNAPGLWTTILSIANHVSGGLWGIFALTIGSFYGLEWPFMFILVINCGLAAGATSSLGPRFSLSRNFTLLTMAPLAVWGFMEGSRLGTSVGVLCLFSMGMFIRMARDNCIWYWEGIRTNAQIAEQARQMKTVFKGVHANADRLVLTSKDLSKCSGEMTGHVTAMGEMLETETRVMSQVSDNSETVFETMERATRRFRQVADSAVRMTVSQKETSIRASEAGDMAMRASEESRSAAERIQDLDRAAEAITAISQSIGDISSQINLLALNATIESARAGNAGRGFAVVANEIKELAVQTAGSVKDIRQQVDDMQAVARTASRDINTIAGVIAESTGHVVEITRDLEQQAASSEAISQDLGEVSTGFGDVSRMLQENLASVQTVCGSIGRVKETAGQVKTGALAVEDRAESLLTLASDMVELVDENPRC